MSMITKLINRLRKAADFRHTIGDYMTAGLHIEAADTIEQLAAKVRAENGGGWIPTEEAYAPTINAIPIPENATNGDVLKRLLYGKAIITEFIHDVNISVNNTVVGQFDMEWWNSPYKRGDTE